MNRIEQYIRSVLVQKRLLEQHLIEDDKLKKYENDPEYDPSTGYIYKIPKTTYGKGDLERLRVHFVDKAAQENMIKLYLQLLIEWQWILRYLIIMDIVIELLLVYQRAPIVEKFLQFGL